MAAIKHTHKFALLLTLLSLLVFCNSCKDDDGPTPPAVTEIAGYWQCAMMKTVDSEQWMSWTYEDSYLRFNSDYTFASIGYFGNSNGSWKYDKSIISCILSDGSQLRFRVIEAHLNTLTLRATNLFGTIDIKVNRAK